jgi:secretion/DNA translocation related CpaE-like protein
VSPHPHRSGRAGGPPGSSAAPSAGPTAGCPVICTSDPELLDALLEVVEVAGVDPRVATNPAEVPVDGAPIVLVGADVSPAGLDGADCLVVARRALDGSMPEAGPIDAVLPDDAERLVGRVATAVLRAGEVAGPCSGVVGGCGGAGATMFAIALARVAVAAGRTVALVDADPLGPGLDQAVGLGDAPGLRWPDLVGVRHPVDALALMAALPRRDGLAVVSGPGVEAVEPAAARAVLRGCRRGTDLVVVDLPRQLTEGAQAMLAGCRDVFVVVPAAERVLPAAARVVERLRPRCEQLRLVVRGPSPGGADGRRIAAALGVPLAADLRAEPHLAALLERGGLPPVGRGPLSAGCRRVLAALGEPAAGGGELGGRPGGTGVGAAW